MSLLHIGTSCAPCNLVDFLPTTCQSCSQTFCSTHIQSHHPCTTSVILGREHNPIAGPSTFAKKSTCEVKGCERVRIEAVGGLEVEREGKGDGIGREVRCGGCGGAFCVVHRAQVDHDCTAPLVHLAKQDAATARQTRAQVILAQNGFNATPHREPIVRPHDDKNERKRPVSPQRLPPSLQAPETEEPGVAAEERKVKTRAEKIWDIHLRKLRSLAKPLDGKVMVGDTRPRRFFECGIDLDGKGVVGWSNDKKWVGKLERVWILADTPLGKILDILIAQNKIPRPGTVTDPASALSLVNLIAVADQPRKTVKLDLARPAETIEEGSMVVLIRGYTEP